MRIALISPWFAEGMGYVENCLPKALASLGPEVHLITTNVQPHFNSPDYRDTYEPFIGPRVVDCGTKSVDGYTLHRQPHVTLGRGLRIRGLSATLRELQPDAVQTFEAGDWTTYEAAFQARRLGYKLFLEVHQHASVYPGSNWRARLHGMWKRLVAAPTLGRWTSRLTQKCYPISDDAAEIAVRYFGMDRQKLCVTSLGVDTDLFHPAVDAAAQQARLQVRDRLGFSESAIVCVYTGRFSPGKDPLCLARAIDILSQQGLPFRGLFVGAGEQAAGIQSSPGCVIHPFVPFRELPALYWAADIAVWPRQESTSQLDAAACGLPLVLSQSVQVRERIDGNGLQYDEGDPADLARQLAALADPERRRQMGNHGARKMREHFSWLDIARQRVRDYEAALAGHEL